MLPAELLSTLGRNAKVVEVGVGGRWETMQSVQADRPDLELVAIDIHEELLRGAPSGVRTSPDDITQPTMALYEGAALIIGVRVPEELQLPLARLAQQVGAVLAFTVVKDEVADLGGMVAPGRILQDPEGRTWRVHAPPQKEGAK